MCISQWLQHVQPHLHMFSTAPTTSRPGSNTFNCISLYFQRLARWLTTVHRVSILSYDVWSPFTYILPMFLLSASTTWTYPSYHPVFRPVQAPFCIIIQDWYHLYLSLAMVQCVIRHTRQHTISFNTFNVWFNPRYNTQCDYTRVQMFNPHILHVRGTI